MQLRTYQTRARLVCFFLYRFYTKRIENVDIVECCNTGDRHLRVNGSVLCESRSPNESLVNSYIILINHQNIFHDLGHKICDAYNGVESILTCFFVIQHQSEKILMTHTYFLTDAHKINYIREIKRERCVCLNRDTRVQIYRAFCNHANGC